MADQIVSWGGVESKGTAGMGVTGSLSLIGNLNFQPGADRFISMSASPTTASGNNIIMQAGNATAGGVGGSLYFRIGTGAGGPGNGAIFIGNQGAGSVWPAIDVSGPTTIYNSGPNTGTSLTINGGGALAMRWDWDNPNTTISAVTAGNRILRFTGASQYQVRGSGTTSATTALLVQNANASASLSVKDDGSVGIGTASPFSSGLTVANPAYTGYGRMYMSANTTFVLADNGTGGNITFGPSNRIFINSSQVSLPSGYISIGGSAIITTSGSYQGTTFSLGNFIAANIGGSTGLTISSKYTQQGAGGPNTGTVVRIIDTGIDTITGVTNTLTMLAINPSVNTTGGTTTLRGIYYNPAMSSSVGLTQHTAIETTAGSVLFNGGNVGIGTSTPSSSLHISGASAVLTLTPQSPLPSGVPTGSFAVSSSSPPKPYFYDGTTWNALY
jgi:hypothetical protein